MELVIRKASMRDLERYTVMMQQTYEDAYVNDEQGLTKACFSTEVFNAESTQDYLKSRLVHNDRKKTWLACIGEDIIGAVSISKDDLRCELSGFYVLPDYQGMGIGKKLWLKALEFAENRAIALDIYTHNKRAIELYEHWGFHEDVSKPHFYRHWREWPDNLQAESMYMIREPCEHARTKRPTS